MRECPQFLYAIVLSSESNLESPTLLFTGFKELVLFDDTADERLQNLGEGYAVVKIDIFALPSSPMPAGPSITCDIEKNVWMTTRVIPRNVVEFLEPS